MDSPFLEEIRDILSQIQIPKPLIRICESYTDRIHDYLVSGRKKQLITDHIYRFGKNQDDINSVTQVPEKYNKTRDLKKHMMWDCSGDRVDNIDKMVQILTNPRTITKHEGKKTVVRHPSDQKNGWSDIYYYPDIFLDKDLSRFLFVGVSQPLDFYNIGRMIQYLLDTDRKHFNLPNFFKDPQVAQFGARSELAKNLAMKKTANSLKKDLEDEVMACCKRICASNRRKNNYQSECEGQYQNYCDSHHVCDFCGWDFCKDRDSRPTWRFMGGFEYNEICKYCDEIVFRLENDCSLASFPLIDIININPSRTEDPVITTT